MYQASHRSTTSTTRNWLAARVKRGPYLTSPLKGEELKVNGVLRLEFRV